MEAKIIKVGNSKGIIIPSKFLKLIGLENRVAIEVEDNKLIITPAKTKPREGWEKAIEEDIAKNGAIKRLMPDFFEDESKNEWEW